MKQCQQCGKENGDDIRHCQACGARLFRPAERPCGQCGIANELGTRYCKGCGTALMPSVVSQRTPNSETTKQTLGPNADKPSIPLSEPEMPEWITRFIAPKATLPESEPLRQDESLGQLMSILGRMVDVAPNEISSIQVRTKAGRTIDLPTDPSEYAEAQRKAKVRTV